jgi:hypothetical protein
MRREAKQSLDRGWKFSNTVGVVQKVKVHNKHPNLKSKI